MSSDNGRCDYASNITSAMSHTRYDRSALSRLEDGSILVLHLWVGMEVQHFLEEQILTTVASDALAVSILGVAFKRDLH